jgi:ATP-dependent RNA helicase HelY
LLDEFSAIRKMLDSLGYIDGWTLTGRGERLRGIYNESDLLLAEAIDHGILYGLEQAELAALMSVFVFDPRSDQQSPAQWPTQTLTSRWDQLVSLHRDLIGMEADLRLVPMPRPDPGFGYVAHQWASGRGFDDLEGVPLAPGDFVRVSRQLVDVLRQLRDVASELEDEALQAMRSIDRGIVAAQGSW